MSKILKLRLGAMCPPIKEQLKEQDFIYTSKEIAHFQKDADAINRLRIRGYIPDSQINKISQKLVNAISKHVEEVNQRLLADN